MHTIVGLFETRAKARRAKGELIRAHIASPNISLHDRSTADSSSLWESLKDSSGFAEDRSFYEEGMRRGRTVLSVRINDEQMNQAAEILSRHRAIDLDTEGEEGKVRVYKRAA